jgi:hypothetical protein
VLSYIFKQKSIDNDENVLGYILGDFSQNHPFTLAVAGKKTRDEKARIRKGEMDGSLKRIDLRSQSSVSLGT